MYIRPIIISLLLAVFGSTTYAQPVFNLIDIVDGLSDNQIRSLSMTPDGRMAIRTASILNIYDGATFKHFHHDKNRQYGWSYNRAPKEYYDHQGRIWMKERGYLLLLDLNTNQFNYDIQEELGNIGVKEKLINLFIDDSQNFWFITDDQTVSFYDTQAKEYIIIEKGCSNFTEQYGIPVEMTQYKNLCWIVYSSGLIKCWDYSSREFILQENKFLHIINELTDRIYIHPDSVGNIWFMYNNGVHFYNRIEKSWTEASSIHGVSNFFTCMDIDTEGHIWLGTSKSGLRHINSQTFEATSIPGIKLTKGGVLVDDIHSVFVDNSNGVWVGTLFQGLGYYHPSIQKFQLKQTISNGTPITSETIRCFFEEEEGTVLVGTKDGLYRFYEETGVAERIAADYINDLCLSVYKDSKKRIWAGTYLNGFFCIDGEKVHKFIRSSTNLEADPNQNISRAIYEDSSGRFWVSVTGGVGELDPTTGKIRSMLSERHPKISHHTLCYYFYPIDKNYFAVVGESGIYYYNTKTDSVWLPETDAPQSLKFQDPNTKYFCLWKDSRGLEWFGTETGIRVWDEKHQKNYRLTIDEGLPNNAVSAILEDNNGSIWASTISGICKINLDYQADEYNFSFAYFSVSDGLQCGKFYDHSALKTKNGTLYFGGVHGFNYFNPDKISYNQSNNKPVFTCFRLFNQEIKEGKEYNDNIILKTPINNTKEIRLRYNENFITLEFAGLNYVNPSQTYYKYKLQNFDEEWNEILCNGIGKTTYTGLRPGEYKFMVYTANNDKVWGDTPATIIIHITPPLWVTNYAILFYILLCIALIYYCVHLLNKKIERKQQKEKELNERKQKEKLNQMKFRFFTTISHEFRTPLTLILTPLDTLIKQQSDPVLKKKLESIYRNAFNLLNIVNQLLEFRKLETTGEKLQLEASDIIKFIENSYIQFKDIAANKHINLLFKSEIESATLLYDHDKMYKIVSNLLSNAFKFTPEYGNVTIHIGKKEDKEKEYICISIIDTGCGIEKNELKSIFDIFYQAKTKDYTLSGSGIGLHIVKEYIHLHQGKITVESQTGKGSTFTIYIPTDLTTTAEESDSETKKVQLEEELQEHKEEAKKKTVLIIEDNEEFRSFLAEQFSYSFHILEAADGESGEHLARSKSPDLIISDLMMPKVDGLELCQRLKKNIQTSHIPFILLTARNSDESKIEGYKAGADSYISKPFNFEILYTRSLKLIEQQEKRKKLFHKSIEITPSSITITSLDEELVKKALILVEENMDNSEYSVEDLSRDVGLSKSQLNRKLQSITELTPLEFIRSIRLKRAAQLLINSQYNVSEIANIVGFNTLKYFNKHFKQEFKMTPTNYRHLNRDEHLTTPPNDD